MGSQSWEFVVVNNEFSTLASTATGFRSALVPCLGWAITTATSASAATATSLDELIFVLSSVESEQFVVCSLCLCVQVGCSQVACNHLSLLLGSILVLQSLFVQLLVLSCICLSKSAFSGFLVEVILESESNFFLFFNLFGNSLRLLFTSLSARLLFVLLSTFLCLNWLFGQGFLFITPIALAVASLLQVFLAGTGS